MIKQPARPSGAQLECRRPPACSARSSCGCAFSKSCTTSCSSGPIVAAIATSFSKRSSRVCRRRTTRRCSTRSCAGPGSAGSSDTTRRRSAGLDAIGIVISFAIVGRGAVSRHTDRASPRPRGSLNQGGTQGARDAARGRSATLTRFGPKRRAEPALTERETGVYELRRREAAHGIALGARARRRGRFIGACASRHARRAGSLLAAGREHLNRWGRDTGPARGGPLAAQGVRLWLGRPLRAPPAVAHELVFWIAAKFGRPTGSHSSALTRSLARGARASDSLSVRFAPPREH
jgi:hypothetical protein